MNWEIPEESNLKRLKCIKDELEELINLIEHQYDNREGNNNFVNNELYTDANYKHKTRTTKRINVNTSNLQQDETH